METLRSVLIVAFTFFVPGSSAHGQICSPWGDLEVVLIGRAEAPLTFRVSGEREIERARQNLVDTEAEVARLRASLDFYTRMERNLEFEIRLSEARNELQMRRDMYPPAYDLAVIPVGVERAIRGVTEATVMVRIQDPSLRMEAGEVSLIGGRRSTNLIPYFPETSDVTFADYVELQRISPAALAQEDLRILESRAAGATIVGELRMHSYGGPAGAPLSGVRIAVSSGAQVIETTTSEDGSFSVSGISPGRLEVAPFLPDDLTVVNKPALTVHVAERGCAALNLKVELNGRLRGRIISATGGSLDGVQLHLVAIPGGSHSPSTTVRPNEDGTFEFSGQRSGSYILSAGRGTMVDGKRRYLATFYPGTPNSSDAVPVVIGKATQHDGFDFLVTTE